MIQLNCMLDFKLIKILLKKLKLFKLIKTSFKLIEPDSDVW